MGSPAGSPIRQMLEGQLSQLSQEVERLFDDARGRARRELADQLNQAVRRIRQAASLDELAGALVDAAAGYAAGAALFRVAGEKLACLKMRGAAAPETLGIPLAGAPALAGAVESRDPVVALTTPAEVSAELVALAGHPADGRAAIFPLVDRERVPALLYCWGAAQGPALEMLAQVGAAVWGSLVLPEKPPVEKPPFVNIAPAPVSTFESLPEEEQARHLRARRFARVQVAEMRLKEAAAVEAGRVRHDLYGILRERIDAARVTFRQQFIVPCSSMVDYLHAELLRSLAHDDADLLGKEYPGPLA